MLKVWLYDENKTMVEPVPGQCSMSFHASFEVLVLLLDLLQDLIQLQIFLSLGEKHQEKD